MISMLNSEAICVYLADPARQLADIRMTPGRRKPGASTLEVT
jgi:hypothetical protein